MHYAHAPSAGKVRRLDPRAVCGRSCVLWHRFQLPPPRRVVPVPAHGLVETIVETDARAVPELLADLRVRQRVPPIVTLPVVDILHELIPVAATGIEQALRQLAVRKFDAPPDVVDLTRAAALQHQLNPLTM